MNQSLINTRFKIVELTAIALAVLIDYIQCFYSFDGSILLYAADVITFAFILYTFIKSRNKKRYLLNNKETILIILVLLASIFVNWKYSDIYSIIRLAELFVFLGGGLVYSGDEDLEQIKRFIVILFGIVLLCGSLMTIISYGQAAAGCLGLVGEETAKIWTKDLTILTYGGVYRNGNRFGVVVFINILLSLYFLKDAKKMKPVIISNLVLNLIMLPITGARAILLAFVFGILVFIVNSNNKKFKLALSILILITGAALVFITAKKAFGYKLDGFVILDQISGSRYSIWVECLNMFKEHPLFGVGLNNINSYANLYPEKYHLISFRRYLSAHNCLVNIIAMTGIFGSAAFIPYAKRIRESAKRLPLTISVMVFGLIIADLLDMYVLFVSTIPAMLVPLLVGYANQQRLREDKAVYFFSNVMDEQLFAKTYVKADRPGQQSQKFNRLIAQGFEKNGIRVVCYTAVLASRSIVDYTVKKFKNSGFYRYSLSINIPGLKNLYHFLSAFFRVLSVEEGYCLVDPLSIDQSLGALFAGKIRRMPVTGVITDLPEHFAGEGFYAKLSYFAFKLCDGYVFLTKQMDELLNPKHKPWILMEGLCDIDAVREVVTERDNALIFAGEIDEQNGVITLIDAFNEWSCDKYELYYYGSGEAMELLKEKSKDNPHVHIMGVVLNKDLIPVMNRATLLLNPRPVNQEFTKYSFPSKLIEYCSTGTYTATSRLVCIPDDYWLAMGDLGNGSSSDILKFFREFETMSSAELNELGCKQRKYVLETRNNKKQAGNIYGLMKEIYE